MYCQIIISDSFNYTIKSILLTEIICVFYVIYRQKLIDHNYFRKKGGKINKIKERLLALNTLIASWLLASQIRSKYSLSASQIGV